MSILGSLPSPGSGGGDASAALLDRIEWLANLSVTAYGVSIGVRVRHWVSFHGVSLNVDPNLEHFAGIVPCGLTSPVTSLAALGVDTDMQRADAALRSAFEEVFGVVSANACR